MNMETEKIELTHDPKRGELFYGKNNVTLTARGQLAWIQRECEKAIGPAASHIIYESARVYAHRTESNIEQQVLNNLNKLSREEIALKLLEQFNKFGYCYAQAEEIDIEGKKAKIKVYNSANAIGYMIAEKPVCHFIRGVIAGAASELLDEPMYCLETRCTASGGGYCLFEVMTSEIAEKKRLGE